MTNLKSTIVYFDGSCALCSAEISVYQKHAHGVRFVDVSKEDSSDLGDLKRDVAMARFHLRKTDGSLINGAEAFVELWRQTPGFRFLVRIFQVPGMIKIADCLYSCFLKIRPSVQKLFNLRKRRAS